MRNSLARTRVNYFPKHDLDLDAVCSISHLYFCPNSLFFCKVIGKRRTFSLLLDLHSFLSLLSGFVALSQRSFKIQVPSLSLCVRVMFMVFLLCLSKDIL